MKAYIAEAIGTCLLTLVLIIATGANPWVATIFGVFTLMYIAYSFGHISGAHVNPALTLGALATGRISAMKALFYIIAQIAGAAGAILIVKAAGIDLTAAVAAAFSWKLFFAEFIGMFVFGYGVAAVMARRVHPAATGFVVGISLFGGIIVSSLLLSGSTMSATLNPAVAYGLNVLSLASILGAILGSIAGMWVFALLSENVKSVCASAKKALTGKDTDNCGCDATCEVSASAPTASEGVKIA
jgi:aquaporin Z